MTNSLICIDRGTGLSISSTTAAFGSIADTPLVSDATETNRQITWREAGTFSNFWIHATANSVASNSTVTFRKNAVNGNQIITVTASTTGEFADATHTDTIVAGDKLSYEMINGATGTITYTDANIIFTPTTTSHTVTRLALNNQVFLNTAGATFYGLLSGFSGTESTESHAQYKSKSSATLQNLFIHVTGNSATIETIHSRINGVNGNLAINITSGLSGFLEDTTHTDSIASGDLINTSWVNTSGTGLLFQTLAIDYLTSNGDAIVMGGQTGGSPITANTTTYLDISTAGSTTEANVKILAQIAGTFSSLECYSSSNTNTGTSTLTFRNNGVNGNQTISIAASTAGYFEDATHTDTVATTDRINLSLTTGVSGTLTLINVGILAAYGSSAATTYAFSGASTGTPHVASGTITLTPTGGNWPSAVTITLSDASTGTFTPSTLSPTGGTNTGQNFTYTAPSAGTFNLSASSGGAMTDPSPWAFTASSGGLFGITSLDGLSISGSKQFTRLN